MKSRLKVSLVLAAVLAVAAGLVACSMARAAGEQDIVRVKRGDIVHSIKADGKLSLPEQRNLTFGVNGRVEEVKVKEGARVTKGQVLARLETASLERGVKTAELGVKSAQVELNQAQNGVKLAKADLKQAENGVKSAEADLNQAEYGVKSAESDFATAQNGVKSAEMDLEQATDSFRKISYPYSYSTFAFDVPEALNYISTAQRNITDAQRDLQVGLTADQYNEAMKQIRDALDNLADGRQRLARGEGSDPFSSGMLPVTDFWTLRDAQLQMDKAKLGVETSKVALSKAQLAVAIATRVLTKAQLAKDGAEATLEKAVTAVDNAEGLLSKARLNMDKSGYDLETATETLNKAIITADFDGVVASVNIKVGDILNQADYTRTAMELIDPQHMEFTLDVDEMDIPGVELGQEATLSVDAMPGLKPTGKVVFVSPVPKDTSGVVQYQVKIAFDVPAGSSMRTGMSSSANIVINQHKNVLKVPKQAVIRNKAQGSIVKVLVDGKTQEKVVETSLSDATDTEIVSGLSEGDVVNLKAQ